MALTLTNTWRPSHNEPRSPTGHNRTATTVLLDSSYTGPGGYALTPAQLGHAVVEYAICTIISATAGAIVAASYNTATSKLVCLASGGEVANATNLSVVTALVEAWGY